MQQQLASLYVHCVCWVSQGNPLGYCAVEADPRGQLESENGVAAKACLANPKCYAFVVNGGKAFLKSAAEPMVNKAGYNTYVEYS
jgi:hypothetical protein